MQHKARTKRSSPATKKRTVRPVRRPNADMRTREYLTQAEIDKLMKAANGNRWGHRDSTMILVAFRHGFRAVELVDLRWDQIDFNSANMAIRRAKKGSPATHPIRGDELRALRRLHREQEPKSAYVFTSERGAPFTTSGFAKLIERLGIAARIGFKTHPHMLRHACGFMPWPTRDTIHGLYKPIWDIRTSSIPCDIPNSRPIGLRTSGLRMNGERTFEIKTGERGRGLPGLFDHIFSRRL